MINKLFIYDVDKLLLIKPLYITIEQHSNSKFILRLDINDYYTNWIKEWMLDLNKNFIPSEYKRDIIFEFNNFCTIYVGCFIHSKEEKDDNYIITISYYYSEPCPNNPIVQIIRNNNIDIILE